MATHHIEITDRPGVIAGPHDRAGLRTPHTLAKWPWIGLLLFLIGGLAFGAITYNVYTSGPITQWDKPLAVSAPAYSLQHASLFKPLTDAGFFIGGWLLTFLGFLALLYFSSWHYWEEFFMLLFGMVGESLLFEIISNVVGRPRPPTQIWNILHIPGFPSGHVEASVVFYGFMAYLLAPRVRPILLKVLIFLGAILIVLFVAFSRVFAAGHYLSDVMGGFALGLTWAALAYTSVELYYRKRRSRNGEKR
jgi:undecaprenyl-diphosphatase